MLVCIRYAASPATHFLGWERRGRGWEGGQRQWEAKFKEERVGEGPDGHTYSHTYFIYRFYSQVSLNVAEIGMLLTASEKQINFYFLIMLCIVLYMICFLLNMNRRIHANSYLRTF
jgi:hypothetical protein